MARCAQCEREGVQLKCSRCRSVHYCDRKCQGQNWNTHKGQCKTPESAGKFQMGEKMILRQVEAARDTRKPIPNSGIFPAQLREFEYRSSPDGVDENLLILLHGSGDNYKVFASFGQKLKLPQTACLALSGPIKLPDEIVKGSLWFEIYDGEWHLLPIGDRRRVESLKATSNLLEEMVEALCRNCEWQRSRIFLFGYADGGTVVLSHALRSFGVTRMGGVISISGSILPEILVDQHKSQASKKEGTPVLLTYGLKADRELQTQIHRTKRYLEVCYSNPQPKVVAMNKGPEMVNSPEEARVLHQFFAAHLYTRMLNKGNTSTLYEVSRS